MHKSALIQRSMGPVKGAQNPNEMQTIRMILQCTASPMLNRKTYWTDQMTFKNQLFSYEGTGN